MTLLRPDPTNRLASRLRQYGAEKEQIPSSKIHRIGGIDYLFDIQDEFIRISKNRDLLLRAQDNYERGFSLLNDSSFVKIRPHIESGNTIKLFVKYINLNKYAHCNFSG